MRERVRIEKKIVKGGKAASTGYGLRAAFSVKPLGMEGCFGYFYSTEAFPRQFRFILATNSEENLSNIYQISKGDRNESFWKNIGSVRSEFVFNRGGVFHTCQRPLYMVKEVIK